MNIEITPVKDEVIPALNSVEKFYQLINSDEIGFFNFPKNYSNFSQINQLCENHSNKKYFVHVGLGGSSLGPKMLLEALNFNAQEKEYFFLDNSDPELFFEVINQIDYSQTLFYIVSKSGSTLETMSLFQLILQHLDHHQVTSEQWKNHFVFCTDPKASELLELSQEHNIPRLEIPSNIGGRYSTLTEVGLFPLSFFRLQAFELLEGAKKAQAEFEKNQTSLSDLASFICQSYKEHKIDQTIIMPYSSKLQPFSDWFVQLWAESLGKDGQGLTPISSYGATDQHSQVQLFLEGPKNKFPIIIGIDRFRHETQKLQSSMNSRTLDKISPYSLNQILQAQKKALSQSFKQHEISYAEINLSEISAFELGQLVMNSMILTSLVGLELGINPYDQPAVESVKVNTWQYLKEILS